MEVAHTASYCCSAVRQLLFNAGSSCLTGNQTQQQWEQEHPYCSSLKTACGQLCPEYVGISLTWLKQFSLSFYDISSSLQCYPSLPL